MSLFPSPLIYTYWHSRSPTLSAAALRQSQQRERNAFAGRLPSAYLFTNTLFRCLGRDVELPRHYENEGVVRAYRWTDVQDLPSTAASLRNVNNFVYFCLLAKLVDLDFRLSKDEKEAHEGVLDYVGRTLSVPALKR